MENQSKEQIKQAINEIKEAQLEGWNEVRDIAEDILAYLDRRYPRFRVVAYGAGSIVTYVQIIGANVYATYTTDGTTTIKELFERFFTDNEALAKMVRHLASAIRNVANNNLDEAEDQ
jgi:hypothetical protein